MLDMIFCVCLTLLYAATRGSKLVSGILRLKMSFLTDLGHDSELMENEMAGEDWDQFRHLHDQGKL